MRRLVPIQCLALLAVALTGCVASRRHAASDGAITVEQETRSSSGTRDARPDLPALTENATLDDYLAYAVANNAGLQAAFSLWNAAVEKVTQARALPDPMAEYRVETRVEPTRHEYQISQMLPWFGKIRLRRDMALASANAERERYETARLKLLYDVKNAYYEYHYLGRSIAITEENVKLLADLEEVARTMYSAGQATHADVIKAQVELGKMENDLRALRDLQAPTVARLNAALNRPSDAPLPRPKALPEQKAPFTDEQALASLRQRNPELRAMDFMAAEQKAAISMAKRESFPDVSLGAEYWDMGEGVMDGGAAAEDELMAMVEVNVPVWRAKYRAMRREATARFMAALQERRDRENMLVADLEMALYGLRNADRKINLYRDALIPRAEQSLTVTRQTFEAGKTDFLNLIDAERLLLEFRLMYEEALASRAQRLAEVEMLVGGPLPKSDSGSPESKTEKPARQETL